MIPEISVTWFRLSRVGTATSFMFGVSSIGSAIGQNLPTVIVQEHAFEKKQLTYLAITQASIVSFAWLVSVCFFSPRPKRPPSAVALAPRFKIGAGLCRLLRSGPFMLLMLSQFLVNAGSVASYNLLELFVAIYDYPSPTRFASIVNAISLVIGFFGNLGIGLLIDWKKQFKGILFLCSLATALVLGLFTWTG